MLDIRLIRNETEMVKKALARRKEVVDIDGILELDAKKRELLIACSFWVKIYYGDMQDM
jgi:seryl-tRNA synthetase